LTFADAVSSPDTRDRRTLVFHERPTIVASGDHAADGLVRSR
jgi:hypothetical protein